MVAAAVRTAWAGEPGLSAVGAAGLVLGLVCLVGVAVRGRFIPPEGKLLDAATFCFGVGVFTITVALLLPLAGYAPTPRRRWRRGFYVFAVYGLVLESLQAFRGLDPRFTDEGGHLDVIAGIIFGLTALSNTILFVVLGLRFFRSDVWPIDPCCVSGSATASPPSDSRSPSDRDEHQLRTRDRREGNLLLSHGLGVHGIQAIPVVALLVAAAATTPPATQWLHAVGIGWLAACAAPSQALLGHAPLEASILTTVIVAGLACGLPAPATPS